MLMFRPVLDFRFVLAGLLLLSGFLTMPAHAADASDPPARVARLNYTNGTVSFAPAGTDDWVSAVLNRPLTEGDRLWVEKGGRAELHVGSTAMRVAGSTGLEVLALNDDTLRLKLTQGSFSIRVRDYPDDEDIAVSTPNLGFSVRDPGEYRFDVDPDRDTTIVSVRRGLGSIYGDDPAWQPVRIAAGQRMRFDGKDLFVRESGSTGPRDELDRWSAQRDDREDASQSARYVSRDMTGYEDLDGNGDWRQVDGYGAVWVPRVTISGWAPYHYGHWAWIAPWGWTWVDDAPWGFAPFHYGRWAYFDGYWGWVPGPVMRRPVYAPALVAFVGEGRSGGVSWGVSLSTGLGGVAWFALGPGEAYRPAYAHNPVYVERINHNITVNRNVNIYVNQRVPHAVAVMPERDFVRGAPMRPGNAPALRGQDFSRMQVREGLPVSPTRESRSGAPGSQQAAPPERVFRQSVVGQQPPGRREAGGREPGARGDERPANNGASRETPSFRTPDARQADLPRQQAQRRPQDPQRQQQDQAQQQQQQDQQRQQQDQQRSMQEQRRQQDQQQRQQHEQQRQQQEQQRQAQDQQRQQEQQRQQPAQPPETRRQEDSQSSQREQPVQQRQPDNRKDGERRGRREDERGPR
ncbi:MAG: uncharacterized protein H6R19_501 [Proteobacteria bacterium]|nr:uncharacterized protein [Pseudomonadota bacterium]